VHDGNSQLRRIVVLHAEGVRHAAPAVDSDFERNTDQVSLRAVRPGVIHAAEILTALAVVLEANQSAPMCAPVFECVDFPVVVACDYDRSVADARGFEIAVIAYLDLSAEEVPDWAAETALLLPAIGLVSLEHTIGDARQRFAPGRWGRRGRNFRPCFACKTRRRLSLRSLQETKCAPEL
jgi:hypothetical protein